MPDVVRAAVQTGPRQLEIREFPRPEVGPDDGLLRVEACGVCGSDVEQYRGTLGPRVPVVPGHEPIGIVEEVGAHAAERWQVSPGDRVSLEVLVPCRNCEPCLSGRYMSCKQRQATHGYMPIAGSQPLSGGFAEYLYLHPNAVVHPMSKDVPLERAAMFNALGAGVRWACHLGKVQLGDTVLVLGCGQRGLAAVLAARAAGAGRIVVTGLTRDRERLNLALAIGADAVIDVEQESVVDRVAELTRGEMADVVLELTPMATEPIADALSSARREGRVVLAGLKGGRKAELVTDVIIQRALTIVGAFGVDSAAIKQATRLIESGSPALDRLHTHTFPLDRLEEALQTLGGEVADQSAVHVMVTP